MNGLAFDLQKMNQPTVSILEHFASLDDPRINRQKKHQLQDIFFITLCAVICGADNWVEIEEYGCAKTVVPRYNPPP